MAQTSAPSGAIAPAASERAFTEQEIVDVIVDEYFSLPPSMKQAIMARIKERNSRRSWLRDVACMSHIPLDDFDRAMDELRDGVQTSLTMAALGMRSSTCLDRHT